METANRHGMPEVAVNGVTADELPGQDSPASCPDTSSSPLHFRLHLRRLSTCKSTTSNDSASISAVTTGGFVCSQEADEVRRLDYRLEKELKDEELPTSNDATAVKIGTPSPYHNWECGFGFTGKVDDPDEIPDTKAEFIAAVKGEVTTIGFIQNGLTSYSEAINSGVHHAFSEDFLKHQTDATHKTIGQLFQISRHLQDIIREVEVVQEDSNEVKAELKQAYAHAQPWIQRTRAILVSSHVFYKINYVLGSDKNKNH